MAYNTGNPVGSTDPRDLFDNAQDLDHLVNGDEPTNKDRLGKSRKSWAGMEQDFANFLAASEYEFVGDYAAYIEITSYNQVIRDGGEFWRAAADTELPYTTTGSGMTESGAFVSVGDAVLRQDLADQSGADVGTDIIGHEGGTARDAINRRTIYVGSVAELETLSPPAGTAVYLTEDGRGGAGTIKAGAAPSDTYSGIFIDTANGNHWERDDKRALVPEMFGVHGEAGGPDDGPRMAEMFRLAIANNARIEGRPAATYRIASDVNVALTELQSLYADFNNATLLFEEAAIFINGPGVEDGAFLETSFTADPQAGDRFVELASTAGIAPGDLLYVFSPALSSGSVNVYHYYVVREIEGSQVWIDGYVEADINPQQVIDDGQTGDIVVSVYKMAAAATVKNALVKINSPAATQTQTIRMRFVREPTVENVSCDGNVRNQIYLQEYGYAKVSGGSPIKAGYLTEPDQGYDNSAEAPGGNSFGYGVIVARGYSCRIAGVFGRRAWHTVDVSRGAMKTVISDSSFFNNAYAVTSHESAWDIVVRGSDFYSGYGVLLTRCVSGGVKGCKFYYPTHNVIGYDNALRDFDVSDNEFYVDMDKVDSTSASFVYRASSSQSSGGITSAGRKQRFRAKNNTMESNLETGGFRCDLGFVDSDGVAAISGNDFINLERVDIRCPEKTDISDNKVYNTSQFGMTLTVYKESGAVNINNNSGLGAANITSGSSLFSFTSQVEDAPVTMSKNRSEFGRLIRCDQSNVTIRKLAFNESSSHLIQGADSTFTVTSAIKNIHRNGLVFGTATVTNDLDNIEEP